MEAEKESEEGKETERHKMREGERRTKNEIDN